MANALVRRPAARLGARAWPRALRSPSGSVSTALSRHARQLRTTPAVCFRPSDARLHGDYEWEDPESPEDVVPLTIIARDGTRHEVAGKVGDNLLYLCHRFQKTNTDLALEVRRAACTLACSRLASPRGASFVQLAPSIRPRLARPDARLESNLLTRGAVAPKTGTT
eukprot:6181004-Prymnesium_polylepis.1